MISFNVLFVLKAELGAGIDFKGHLVQFSTHKIISSVSTRARTVQGVPSTLSGDTSTLEKCVNFKLEEEHTLCSRFSLFPYSYTNSCESNR